MWNLTLSTEKDIESKGQFWYAFAGLEFLEDDSCLVLINVSIRDGDSTTKEQRNIMLLFRSGMTAACGNELFW